MSSDGQIEANQRNAKRSTGPRTKNGKARVASNAIKHGLSGKQFVIPTENPKDFDDFQTRVKEDLNPQGELETILTERIVADAWRLRRVALLEAALYRRGFQEHVIEELGVKETAALWDSIQGQAQTTPNGSSDCSAHDEAMERLDEARSERSDPSVAVTRGLELFAGPFANLRRHESPLSRSLFRSLHELQRLQAIRAGERVAPPAVSGCRCQSKTERRGEPRGDFTKQTHLTT
jgi:hypothetical protein